MYVIGYIWPAAQACRPYIAYNGIMLNRSLGLLSAGLSLKRTVAAPRAPPGSPSPVRWVSAVPTVLALPSRPALSVPWRASPLFRYCLFLPARRAPPCQCFRSVSVPPGRGCWRYRLFLPYRPAPPDQCFVVPCSVGGTVRSCPTVPTRPIRAFVRSPFGGRWPSRIPIAAQSKFAHRSES